MVEGERRGRVSKTEYSFKWNENLCLYKLNLFHHLAKNILLKVPIFIVPIILSLQKYCDTVLSLYCPTPRQTTTSQYCKL